ncbi:MAG: NUDIX domain-containing protein [Candidatus Magnetoovum sp. WYHC-5]|nr:NUDIX domain-containing protein [Candidatus Magnetoovum sp. WYHC-5]
MKEVSYGIVPIQKGVDGYSFLLIQHNAGHWAFPKGHGEEGETPVETAQRELAEETGITDFELLPSVSPAVNFEEHYTVTRQDGVYEKTVIYFLAIIAKDTSVSIQEEEIKDYKWLDFKSAIDIITFEESKNILRRCYRYIQEHGI